MKHRVPPPDILASALQDRIHESNGMTRAAKSVKAPTIRDLTEREKERREVTQEYHLDKRELGCADALMAVFGMTRAE